MKFNNLLRHLTSILQHLGALMLIFIYVFLIAWTYCYSLYVCYVLITALLSGIIILFIRRSKRLAVEFLLVGGLLFLLFSPINIKQFNKHAEDLQRKVNNLTELTSKEKLGIYGTLILVTVVDVIPFPETAIENFYLFFPDADKKRIFNNDSFLKSPSILGAINRDHQGEVAWNKWDFVFNTDFRYALAFDPCTLKINKAGTTKHVELTTDFGYRKNYTTIHASHIFGGIFAFRIDEGLFWYLEQEDWLHPYTSVWVADL